jgi:peptidoglycan/LPS O-acetylase OafA/YrhL
LFLASKRFGPQVVAVGTLAISGLYSCAVEFFGLRQHLPYAVAGHPVFLLFWFTWACGFYLAEVEAGRARLPARLYPAAFVCGALGIVLFLSKITLLIELCWAIAFSAVLAYALKPGRGLSRALTGFLSWVGLFSYSLYAIHLPIIQLCRVVMMPAGVQFHSLLPALGVAVLCVAGAWLFFQLVECWSLNLKPFERKI